MRLRYAIDLPIGELKKIVIDLIDFDYVARSWGNNIFLVSAKSEKFIFVLRDGEIFINRNGSGFGEVLRKKGISFAMSGGKRAPKDVEDIMRFEDFEELKKNWFTSENFSSFLRSFVKTENPAI